MPTDFNAADPTEDEAETDHRTPVNNHSEVEVVFNSSTVNLSIQVRS